MKSTMYEDKVILLCSNYAAIAHSKQLRKDKQTPYIAHPGRVAYNAIKYGSLGYIGVCAAWLHDVMEDCAVEGSEFVIQNHIHNLYRDIRLFLLDNPDIDKVDGKKILELTIELTMSQDKRVSKRIRKVQYIDNIANGSLDAAILKYCDRIDNLTTCHIFSKGGFFAYIEDTQMILDKLGDKVKCVNHLIHLHLERKLEEAKQTYKQMYEKP